MKFTFLFASIVFAMQAASAGVVEKFTLECQSIDKKTSQVNSAQVRFLENFEVERVNNPFTIIETNVSGKNKRYRVRLGNSSKVTSLEKFYRGSQPRNFFDLLLNIGYGETEDSFFHCDTSALPTAIASRMELGKVWRESCISANGDLITVDGTFLDSSKLLSGQFMTVNGKAVNEIPLFDNLPVLFKTFGTFSFKQKSPELTGFVPLLKDSEGKTAVFVRENALSSKHYEILTDPSNFFEFDGSASRRSFGLEIDLGKSFGHLDKVFYVERSNDSHSFSSGFEDRSGGFSDSYCNSHYIFSPKVEKEIKNRFSKLYFSSHNKKQILIDLVESFTQL